MVYNESDLARAGLAEEERTKHDRRLLKGATLIVFGQGSRQAVSYGSS